MTHLYRQRLSVFIRQATDAASGLKGAIPQSQQQRPQEAYANAGFAEKVNGEQTGSKSRSFSSHKHYRTLLNTPQEVCMNSFQIRHDQGEKQPSWFESQLYTCAGETVICRPLDGVRPPAQFSRRGHCMGLCADSVTGLM